MADFAVLTATTGDLRRVAYLHQLAQSVEDLATRVDLEWHILVDGPKHDAPLPRGAHIHIHESPQRQGLACCRNRLLHASTAPVVLYVDDDDVLLPDAIAQSLENMGAAAWVAGRAMHLFPDGTRAPFRPSPIPEGPCRAGAAMCAWREVLRRNPIAYCPLLLTATLIQRDALHAAGGVPTHLTHAADIASIMRVSELHAGIVTHEPFFLYRYHPHQSTQDTCRVLDDLNARTMARRYARGKATV